MINLSEKSFELLKKILAERKPDLVWTIEEKKSDEFDEAQYNELRDIVSDELVQKGFIYDVPTKYGIELENLIDEIGRLFL